MTTTGEPTATHASRMYTEVHESSAVSLRDQSWQALTERAPVTGPMGQEVGRSCLLSERFSCHRCQASTVDQGAHKPLWKLPPGLLLCGTALPVIDKRRHLRRVVLPLDRTRLLSLEDFPLLKSVGSLEMPYNRVRLYCRTRPPYLQSVFLQPHSKS